MLYKVKEKVFHITTLQRSCLEVENYVFPHIWKVCQVKGHRAQLSGHKNVASIKNYAVASLDQQKQMCEVLQGNKSKTVPVASASTDCSVVPTQAVDHNVVQSPHATFLFSTNNQSLDVYGPGVSSIFAGANLFGHVYINSGR